MKQFKIFILQTNPSTQTYIKIPIGQSLNSLHSSPFTTYDEKISQKTNSQQELSFSLSLFYNKQRNPFSDLIVNNQYLRLVFPETYKPESEWEKIDFIITRITPTISSSNIIYSITAQDLFSYQLSKQGVGLTYKTDSPLRIDELAKLILVESRVSHWVVDPTLEQKLFSDFPDQLYNTDNISYNTIPVRCSLDVSSSTCYNALVEIANMFDAIIKPVYNENSFGGTIYFINKKNINFKGYRLLPTVNLNSFTLNKNSSNFSSLMHVFGGEDAEGGTVSILPTMPSMIAEWLDMYTLYSSLPNPEVHNYPVCVVEEDSTYYLYESNIKRGTSHERFYKLYKEYGKGEEIKCTYTLDKSLEEQAYSIDVVGVTTTNIVIGATYGNTMDQTVVSIQFTPTSAGSFAILNLKEDDVLIDTALFDVKAQTWINGGDYYDTPWELVSDFSTLATRIWNDPNTLQWRDKPGNTRPDIVNYCRTIQDNVKAAGEFIYDFNYFLEAELIDPINFNILNNCFKSTLRNINLKIQILNKQYQSINYTLQQLIYQEQELVSMVAASFEQVYEYYKESVELNSNISSQLYSSKVEPTSSIENLLYSPSLIESLSLPVEPSTEEEQADMITLQQDCYNQITQSIQNLISNIWTEKYFRLIFMLHGTNYFQELYRTNYNQGIQYTNEYFRHLANAQEILDMVDLDMVGGATEKDKINNLTYQKQCDYFYHIGKAEGLIESTDFYYNAEGEVSQNKDEDHPFRKLGYYSTYALLIKELVLANNNSYNKILTDVSWLDSSITKRLELLKSAQDQTWSEIYEKYGSYVVESNYEDSTQLTSSGLYSAALKEFLVVSTPTVDYSASMIDYNSITDANYDTIQVGDKIKVYNDMLFQKKVKNELFVRIESEVLIGNFQFLLDEDEIISHTITKEVRLSDGTYKLTLADDVSQYELPYLTKVRRSIDTPTIPIIVLGYNYISDPIELQITAISKTLREANMQLTVQNNKTINSLVDKLLYSVRKS